VEVRIRPAVVPSFEAGAQIAEDAAESRLNGDVGVAALGRFDFG
jgi:hypothetical protein